MTREEKQDLAKEALRYLVRLLPPEQYGENQECEIIERALQTLASDGVSADVSISACKHCGKNKTEHSSASKMCSNGFNFFESEC